MSDSAWAWMDGPEMIMSEHSASHSHRSLLSSKLSDDLSEDSSDSSLDFVRDLPPARRLTCPSCKNHFDMTLPLSHCHEHIKSCLLSRRSSTRESTTPTEQDTRARIASIRNSLTKLDLRDQIALMEGLRHLAHTAVKAPRIAPNHEEQEALSSPRTLDALSLLFTPNDEEDEEDEEEPHYEALKVEVACDPLLQKSSETTTPVQEAVDQLSIFALKSGTVPLITPEPPQCKTAGRRSSTKRKLVSQALSFSPRNATIPGKMQRTAFAL